MSNVRTLARSFNGGEVTPEFWGQIADQKFQTGLAFCRNFEVLPHGPVQNRAGFAFVREVKTSARRTRLIPFTFSTTQTFVIELGHQYLRFHTQGGAVLATPQPWTTGVTYSVNSLVTYLGVTYASLNTNLNSLPPGVSWRLAAYDNARAYAVGDLAISAGVTYYCIAPTTGNAPPNATYWYALPATGEYEIPTPFVEADLFDVHYVQSADVLTLVHPNYPPAELRRLGAIDWVLANISFASTLTAPTGVAAVATTGTGTTSYSYKVTAVSSDGKQQSLASSSASCTNNLLTTGNKNTVSWSAVTGATRYRVYKQSNGLYGYVGQTDGLSFIDDNILADISNTPPEASNPFNSAGNYPGAVSYFEQRRCFAGTLNAPQSLWMTRSGTESDLTYSIPTKDDDAIQRRVAAREANTIRHIVPLTNLVLLTSAAEWRVTSVNSDAITPDTINVKPQSYLGANNAQPVTVNNNLIFAAARGGHMRELAYSWQAQGYQTGDLSLRAPHLFDSFDVVDMAYVKSPQPMIWAVSSSGKLLGFTYVPEQQVGAWHQHDTDGIFESIAVVAEGAEDVLYAIVQRTIGGVTKRYVERKRTRQFIDPADAFFVDSGATYIGVPVTTISGLTWLEGKTVSILADGAEHPQRAVTGGAITLDQPASKVQVGLPITADLQTLPMTFETMAFGQGRPKNVNRVFLRVYRSSGVFAGPAFDKLREFKQRTTEPYGSPPALKTDEIEVVLAPTWQYGGQVCVRQAAPLPLTITSMTIEAAIGG